jgi:hypothetical protein
MDTTTIMPVVLELFLSCGENAAERDATLANLESFLVRRMICPLTPKNDSRLAVDLIKSLTNGRGSPRDRLQKVLLASDADTLRWPTDAEFGECLQTDPLYRVLTRKRLRLFMRALEQHLRTGKTEDMALPRKLTVEHLLPRRWRQHWPLPENAPADAAGRRDQLLHTLGNLTLLTKKLNTSVSNGPWDKKMPRSLCIASCGSTTNSPPITRRRGTKRRSSPAASAASVSVGLSISSSSPWSASRSGRRVGTR